MKEIVEVLTTPSNTVRRTLQLKEHHLVITTVVLWRSELNVCVGTFNNRLKERITECRAAKDCQGSRTKGDFKYE